MFNNFYVGVCLCGCVGLLLLVVFRNVWVGLFAFFFLLLSTHYFYLLAGNGIASQTSGKGVLFLWSRSMLVFDYYFPSGESF